MTSEEKVLREVFEKWRRGLPGLLDSFATHCTLDVRWWNSARGVVEGLDECLAALRMLVDVVEFQSVEVRIRSMVSSGHTVYVERSDALFAADGSLIADPPVFGVVEFQDGRIREWRDYAADWLSDFTPEPS